MSLEAGQVLLHYRLVDKIGEGGMGVVWRATDTTLEREVAIKVLPHAFADSGDRLARFEREAKLLASLNHPGIAAVYGLHEQPAPPGTDQETIRFLAMELVPGEDLSVRLARGPINKDEAFRIARGVAEALEAAHQAGVVHRDLKPANIQLTPEGKVKVLDFGLAKAFDAAAASGSGAPASLSLSPTMTSAGTVAGVILGTAGYMSPEQARGRSVDTRADLWAFGVVLWEMLTGRQLFAGETVSDTLAAVLRADPEWDQLPTDTPPFARRLARRCLTRDPHRRLQAIGDARVEIEEWLTDPVGAQTVDDQPAVGEQEPRRFSMLPWLVTFLAVMVATGVVAIVLLRGEKVPPRPLRAQIVLDPPLMSTSMNTVFLPDGNGLLYSSGAGADARMWRRDLWQRKSREISGTEGVWGPSLSRDGQWLAFFADGALKKIPVDGGATLDLAEATSQPRGSSWSGDGWIYYAPGTSHGIWRVRADGGEPQEVTALPGEDDPRRATTNSHRWPTTLPGDRALIYLAGNAGDFSAARIESLNLEDGEVQVLHENALYPRYLSSGHLAFVYQGALMVMELDPETVEILSPPRPLLRGVLHSVGNGGAHFAVSDSGALLYVEGEASTVRIHMELETGDGKRRFIREPGAMFDPRISPDGRYIAYTLGLANNADIWVHDLDRDVASRLTLDASSDTRPIWTPDGQWITYSSTRHGGSRNVFRKRADGTGEPERLIESDLVQLPVDWSPDGRSLLLMQINAATGPDLLLARFDADGRLEGELEAWVQSDQPDWFASFSPDGRWVAYESGESGRSQIYLRATDGSGRWQISSDGGRQPRWDVGGKRILYFVPGAPDVTMMAVDFSEANGRPVIGRSEEIEKLPLATGRSVAGLYDIHPKDGRLLVLTSDWVHRQISHPVLIQDWYADVLEEDR